MICRADTIGVFQIESRAQMSMLPRLKPRCFYDLVIEVAIVRPGPIQGGMVHPYLKRRAGPSSRQLSERGARRVLRAHPRRADLPGAGDADRGGRRRLHAGEADQLRRAMAAWKRRGGLEPFRERLLSGMAAQWLQRANSPSSIYKQILGFGEYGFPESHAASFALLTYVSCWLKRHEPAAFFAALINSQPMGFYTLSLAAAAEAPVELPRPDAGEEILADYRQLSLSTTLHPLALLRERLRALGLVSQLELRALPNGAQVRVSGIVTHMQQPGTASGVVFASLEDETGIVNVILWPKVFEAQKKPALTASLLEVDGTLQNQHGVAHVVARRLHDRSHWIQGLARRSRDFH
jgi:DNA polymerase III alpha subunit